MATPEHTTPEDSAELARLLDEALGQGLQPDELPAAQRQRMHRRIRAGVRADALPGTVTVRDNKEDWQPTLPGVRVKILRQDRAAGNQTWLVRIDPGSVIPGHLHSQEEECLVLEGDLEIGELVLNAGDAHFAAPGSTHPPLVSRGGALLLLRSEIPPGA